MTWLSKLDSLYQAAVLYDQGGTPRLDRNQCVRVATGLAQLDRYLTGGQARKPRVGAAPVFSFVLSDGASHLDVDYRRSPVIQLISPTPQVSKRWDDLANSVKEQNCLRCQDGE